MRTIGPTPVRLASMIRVTDTGVGRYVPADTPSSSSSSIAAEAPSRDGFGTSSAQRSRISFSRCRSCSPITLCAAVPSTKPIKQNVNNARMLRERVTETGFCTAKPAMVVIVNASRPRLAPENRATITATSLSQQPLSRSVVSRLVHRNEQDAHWTTRTARPCLFDILAETANQFDAR